MAGFIDLTTYNDFGDVKKYLSFMHGKKHLAEYFTNFIGADDKKETIKQITTTLFDKIKEYATSTYPIKDEYGTINEENILKQQSITESTFEYCKSKFKNKEEVTLEEISNQIDQENPIQFLSFAQEGENQVDSIIEQLDNPSIDNLNIFSYSKDGISLKFDRDLTEGDNPIIFLTNDGNELRIILTDDMKNKIKDELPL